MSNLVCWSSHSANTAILLHSYFGGLQETDSFTTFCLSQLKCEEQTETNGAEEHIP